MYEEVFFENGYHLCAEKEFDIYQFLQTNVRLKEMKIELCLIWRLFSVCVCVATRGENLDPI